MCLPCLICLWMPCDSQAPVKGVPLPHARMDKAPVSADLSKRSLEKRWVDGVQPMSVQYNTKYELLISYSSAGCAVKHKKS